MKKLLKCITSRSFIISFLLFLQVSIITLIILFLSSYFVYVYTALTVLSIIISILIISKDTNPMYKIAFIFPILIFPAIGGFLYFFFDKRNISKGIRKKVKSNYYIIDDIDSKDQYLKCELKMESVDAFKQSSYISNSSLFPLYKNTFTEILTPGEKKFDCLLNELRKAKNFIFIEYFIIEEGKMWNSILDILKQKVKEGVDVRVIYDDIGTINLLPKDYNKKLESYGIKASIFNIFKPSLDVFLNYRDHRKILIIDGHTAFTGGINLADEYINHKVVHGHWKDLSILLKGEAVFSFTIMFLQMWFLINGEIPNYEDFHIKSNHDYKDKYIEGFVQPFNDSPTDEELVSEFAYMNIINNAKEYIYITSPYLILDNEMVTALSLAAKNGIDVRIITPGIPDKWYVHETTRSNYAVLISNGIKIYEYSPGFIHSKYIVSDNEVAIVGTANFDYRSFYLHFECGVWLYKTESVYQLVNDFNNTLKLSKKISLSECNNINFSRKILRLILKIFSPLM